MPKLFKIGCYWVYFWSDESQPLEPVHVHVSEGRPSSNATKIWITATGKCLKCHNKSHIPDNTLRNIMRMIELRAEYIVNRWQERFGEVCFYC